VRKFFARKPLRFTRRGQSLNFEPVRLPDNEDWLLAPVLEGMCSYESLLDGTVDLADIARMNDAISARNENSARARKAMEGR